jgi:D-inositol-3-phosphate glycosyltransferase
MSAAPVIGIVVPALDGGGGVPAVADFMYRQIERTGRYRLKLYSLATSHRDECNLRLLAPRSWLHSPRTRAGTWQGRPYTHVGAASAEFEFQRYRPRAALTRLLRQCDLIQVVAGSPAVALVAAQCDRPVVLQVATRIVVERARALGEGKWPARTWRQAMTACCNRLDDEALATVDAVMVENRWMLDYASARAPGGRSSVHMAPPGVDATRYHPVADRSGRVLQDPYFLFVGRLADPRKNVALLCDAYVQLCAQWPDAPRLVIAGQGELPDAARCRLATLARPASVTIVPAPESAELLRLYQGAACLVVPSTEEGFGMVIIEAMACGVPVIATRCGGPEEIIAPGVDGMLVALDDAGALAAAMRAMSVEPAHSLQMGMRARTRVEAAYADDVSIVPFLESYARLLA